MKPAPQLLDFAPSNFIASCMTGLTDCPTMVALDVACGLGRHSLALAALGHDVIPADADEAALRLIRHHHSDIVGVRGEIHPVVVDLSYGIPIAQNSLGVIVAVHYPMFDLIPIFGSLLMPGGYLILETFGLQGGNWMALPKAGYFKDQLSFGFELLHYRERQCTRSQVDAVSVQAFARRSTSS